MMVKRYELSDQQWKRIEPLLLGKPGQTGRNNRLFVDGVCGCFALAPDGRTF